MPKPRVVAFVPAKGSSSRIENKNTRLLDGKPLFLHTLEKLMACPFIDEVILDSECDAIHEMAAEIPCTKMRRDPALASNATDGNSLFMNEVRFTEADIYIQVLCTSPFIRIETIRQAVDRLLNSDTYDSAVLVRKDKLYLWNDDRPVYDIDHIPNSNTLPDTTIETMGLYVMRREAALGTGRRIGMRPFLIEASPLDALDVNFPEDLPIAELIAAGKREHERRLFANIRGYLTSPLLSDTLDELGYRNQVIKGLSPNMGDAKIFGRAKTLKIRRMREGEDYRGIYDALQSYKTIVPNDVIMVENEVPDYAYFGELNANLALRCGAVGVVVGGMTRDTFDVRRLGLPVFARGSTCQDVKGRAVTESINRTIHVEGVEVRPNSMVFGDGDGIVVIPPQVEQAVLERTNAVIGTEKKILADVALGVSVDRIISEHGFF
ncbi:MAG: cytidyltransferase [Burkholderiaceae bacterium]|nr:cytidyltransferase [Burkholderiaceae bacterium]